MSLTEKEKQKKAERRAERKRRSFFEQRAKAAKKIRTFQDPIASVPEQTGKMNAELEAATGGLRMTIFGHIGAFGVTGEDFDRLIQAKGRNAKVIHLEINSGGGSVFEASHIYSILARHKAKVIVDIVGVAASAATIISMAGNERRIAGNANFMIHEVRGGVSGTSAEIRSYLKLVDNANKAMISTYAVRTGRPESEIRDLIAVDTWLSAAEALEGKFVDKIVDDNVAEPHVTPNSQINTDQRIPASEFAKAQGSIDTLVASLTPTSEPTKPQTKTDGDMTFEKWLLENFGLKESELSAEKATLLRARFKAGGGDIDIDLKVEPTGPGDDDFLNARAKQMDRAAAIEKACKGNLELAAKALRNPDAYDDDRIAMELENIELKARAGSNATDSGGGFVPPEFNFRCNEGKEQNFEQVIEAAVCISMGMTDKDLMDPFEGISNDHAEAYGRQDLNAVSEKALDLAHREYGSCIGLQALMHETAKYDRVNGIGRVFNVNNVEATFTSVTLPKVFDVAVRRQLLKQFKRQNLAWRKLAATDSVKDFRTTEKFRFYGTGAWDRWTPDGNVKTGEFAEGDGYTNKLETYGQYVLLTREEFINDDLGALKQIAKMMTHYGTLAPEFLFWQTLLDAQSNGFFSAANGNLITGPEFGLQGVKALWEVWCNLLEIGVPKDKKSKPIYLDYEPEILVVPKSMKIDAEVFLGTKEFGVGGGGTSTELVTTKNPFYQQFELMTSNYLSNTNFNPNASNDAFYMFTNPNVLAAIELVFLNGVQRPTIQRVQANWEKMGWGFLGYIDVGANTQEKMAAAKSQGQP